MGFSYGEKKSYVASDASIESFGHKVISHCLDSFNSYKEASFALGFVAALDMVSKGTFTPYGDPMLLVDQAREDMLSPGIGPKEYTGIMRRYFKLEEENQHLAYAN